MAESGLEEGLKGKIAGVPAWGVGVGLAGLFIAVMYMRGRGRVTPPPTSPTGAEDTGTPVNTDGEYYGLPAGPIGNYLGQDPTNPAYPTGFTARGLPSPITNVQWSRLITDELLARGSDPTLVYNALTKFLSGQNLSQSEQAVVNLGLKIIGSPPEGLLPVQTGPPPAEGGDDDPPPATDTSGYKYADISEGLTLPIFLDRVRAENPNLTLAELKRLNPDLTWAYSKAGIGYVPENTFGATPTFGYNARIRIK